MSADNHIVIEEGKDGIFRGYDRFIERDYSNSKMPPDFEASSLRKAIEAADKYMSETIVEYGYTFDLLPSTVDKKLEPEEVKFFLEPGKMYCLSISNDAFERFEDLAPQLEHLKKTKDISFLILCEGIEIISIPKGYKVTKESE